MRVRKSIAYTVYGLGLIIVGFVGVAGRIVENDPMGLVCGIPAFIVGIILLIRGISHIKRDGL